MLKYLTRFYIFSGIVLFFLLIKNLNEGYLPIYIYNFFVLISFGFIVLNQNNNPKQGYGKVKLLLIIFIYSSILVFINNLISYSYRENFFVFSEFDAGTYNALAIAFNNKLSFIDGIKYLLEKHSYDDLGAVVVISSLYNISESNIIVNIFYVFVGLITASGIFNIAKNFLTPKNTYLCTLVYSISSYTIWFHSSGLKESFLVMLVVFAFSFYYNYWKNRNPIQLIYCAAMLVSIVFFRPAISYLIIASIFLSLLLVSKFNFFSLVNILVIAIVLFFFYTGIMEQANKFTSNADMTALIEAKESENMIKGSVNFTYFVNILSSFLGPFPSFIPNNKTLLSFFSAGLLYKVLLSIPFLVGIYLVIIKKVKILFPILLFLLLEIFSLVLILEALELRKSLSHFPFVFLIIFWFIDQFENKSVLNLNQKQVITKMTYLSSFILLGIVVYWNFRN